MRDNGQIAIRKAHMSLRIRGAKTEKKIKIKIKVQKKNEHWEQIYIIPET